jgi:hypothetical protein
MVTVEGSLSQGILSCRHPKELVQKTGVVVGRVGTLYKRMVLIVRIFSVPRGIYLVHLYDSGARSSSPLTESAFLAAAAVGGTL